NFTIEKAAKKITVSRTSVKKAYGSKAFSLGAKTVSGEKLTYATNAKKVATVNAKGKVTVKNIGKAIITITSKESANYKKAVKKVTITVQPKKEKISSVKSSKTARMTVKWKKDAKASGYQITYSTSKKFTKAKTKSVAVKSYKTTSKTISKLKKGKTYYVKVRAYKTVNGKKIYGTYSAVKKIKIK
ncbi:MAG: fibronectin type III domain-containing protein, partial [Roseburia sp.]|nr:fibronectin type III domain-containing protein [Roseburia sp.]